MRNANLLRCAGLRDTQDATTYSHILDRAKSPTAEGRTKATHNAVSQLCSDGPDRMLLVARWMETAAETMKNTTLTADQELPWREVVPPFFLEDEMHKDLFALRPPQDLLTLKKLQDFFVAEGFIDTEEEKLRQFMEAKRLSGKLQRGKRNLRAVPCHVNANCVFGMKLAYTYFKAGTFNQSSN